MPESDQNNLRVIDANINRANEAFRVIEDALRFVVEDEFLTQVCKRLRHDFAAWHQQFDVYERVAMRNATQDVGRTTDNPAEYQRADVDEILHANFSRATQSLRTIEEFSKTIGPQLAKEAERFRYRIYDFEQATLTLQNSIDRMRDARLYVLTDVCGGMARFPAKIDALIAAGVDVIQMRDRSMDDRGLFTFGRRLVEATRPHGVISIINDRVDIAVAVGADGVHLGQEDMPIKQARQIAGPRMLLGISAHTLLQAHQAVLEGANYIGVGPTFPSKTKSFDAFTGLELLREVADEITLPSFAIGGINAENLDRVLESGMTRIAISGAVPEDPEQIGVELKRIQTKLRDRRISADL